MNKHCMIVLLSFLAIPSSFAGGYGSAGCGLGSMVIGNSHGIVQIFAATTNGTSASQTFGITSGTSNCGGGGSSPTAEQYIEANRVSLASEISKGNGETVKGLARIMGCAKTEEFQTALQKNYKKIFPSQDIDAGKINTAIHHVIGESPELKNTCKSG